MNVEQLDLFALNESALNGFYYEESSRRFVSYVLGRRHFEVLASRCNFPKEWQEKIKRERSI